MIVTTSHLIVMLVLYLVVFLSFVIIFPFILYDCYDQFTLSSCFCCNWPSWLFSNVITMYFGTIYPTSFLSRYFVSYLNSYLMSYHVVLPDSDLYDWLFWLSISSRNLYLQC